MLFLRSLMALVLLTTSIDSVQNATNLIRAESLKARIQFLANEDSAAGAPKIGFDLVTLILKMNHGGTEFFAGPQAIDSLRRIQGGWRPVSSPKSE